MTAPATHLERAIADKAALRRQARPCDVLWRKLINETKEIHHA